MTKSFTVAIGVVVAALSAGPRTLLQAQSPAAPSTTTALLQAKVTQLEEELLAARRDYGVLLTTCQSAPDQIARASTAIETAGLAAANTIAADRQQQAMENAAWFVKDATYGVTEANRIFVRYGWRVTVKNGIPRGQLFDLVVRFLDVNGLTIDTARLYNQPIAAGDERTVYGDALISQPGAQRVVSVHAVATRK